MSSANGRAQLRLVETADAIERPGDSPLAHREHAVAQPGELGEIAGAHERTARRAPRNRG